MSDTSRNRDPWRAPALTLWILFFLIGLAPEQAYYWLREFAGVLPQRALVNSYHLVTLGLAAYVGLFSYNRCLEAGLSPREAQDRGLQLTVVGLVAFLSVDFRLVLTAHLNPIFQYRLVTYFVGASKLIAWWSLMALFIRYYGFGDGRAFAGVPSLFPSTRREKHAVRQPSASNEETPSLSPPDAADDAEEQQRDRP